MIIRPARKEDALDAKELLEQFCHESLNEYGLKVTLASVQRVARECAQTSLVLEHEGVVVGILAGAITVNPLDNSRIWQEVVWFVNKQFRRYGVKLLQHMEQKANKEWGCAGVLMASMNNSKQEKLDAFYTKTGYALIERHYYKAFGG